MSGMGAFDYVMTVTKNEAYLSQVPQETLDYYYSFPGWMFILWAVGSFGGLIGAVLLLLRKASAVGFLLASVVAGVLSTVCMFAFSGGLEVTGKAALIVAIVFLVVGALFVFYARRMRDKGVIA
jgi:lysylphosphatidylglycerol synthetase-like protein (DUF2156 family)